MDAYTVILSPDPDSGGFAAIVPAMPGALTQGDDLAEALRNAAEVMSLWLEVASERGQTPLLESPKLIADEVASVLEDRDAAGWDHEILLRMVTPEPDVVAA